MHEFPTQDAIEVKFGVPVYDPYRWLEDRASPETERWLEVQHSDADSYFRTCEGVEHLRERVRALLDREEIEQPVRVNAHIFFQRRDAGQEQACIYVASIDTGAVRLLVDPTRTGVLSSALIHRVNADGSLLAFAIATGGSDTKEIHFMDTDTGSVLTDSLPVGRSRGIEFFTDNTGYYYSHDGAVPSADGVHSICAHSFGSDRKNDPALFTIPRSGLSKLILLGDMEHLGALYIYENMDGFKSDLYIAPRSSDLRWKLFCKGLPGSTSVVLRHHRVFFFSETVDGRRFLECSLLDRDNRYTVVPVGEKPLCQVSIRDDRIYSHRVDGLESEINMSTIEGRHICDVDVPRSGTIHMCQPLGSTSETLFYTCESFDSPPTVFQFEPETRSSQPLFRNAGAIRVGKCTSLQTSYPAKDHAQIPVTLLTDERWPLFQDRLVLMTSYGGFGVSMTPRFSVLVRVMLELGASFVVPHIRGGGEGGSAWHRAAVGRNRQVAFDDFIWAAEWLCQQRVTSPNRLAIFGGSNSGLLVAAVSMQRPALFRAVLCISGLLDMLRYEHFDRAAKWRAEFGSVGKEAEFNSLRSYSPYHQVQTLTNYPSMLFVSGDQDERCNPAHSRKMVAQLQQRPVQRNPILLDYATYRGHSPALPISIRVEALTFRLAFLCRELGIDLQERLSHVATAS